MMKFATGWKFGIQCATLWVLLIVAGTAPAQQAFPTAPIRAIVPTAAGGSTDILARLVAQQLATDWGQSVIVDNRSGGNGLIAGEDLKKAPRDGSFIMITSSAHIITPLLATTPYDAVKDFTAIAGLATSETLLVVHPSLPVTTLQEFIAFAKSRPGQLDYATGGTGTLSHLVGASFEARTGVKMQPIAYRSGGPAIADLLGGHVKLYFAVPISIMPYIKSGNVRPIAVTGSKRLAALPDVPTFSEAGLSGFNIRYWYGILGPPNMPKDIVDKYSIEVAKVLSRPEIKEKLSGQGMDTYIATPDELRALMERETAQYAEIIKAAHIKLEN